MAWVYKLKSACQFSSRQGLTLLPQTLAVTVFIVANRMAAGSKLRSAKPLTAKQDTFTQGPATLLTKQLTPGVAWTVRDLTQAKGSVRFGTAKTLSNSHLPCSLPHFLCRRTRSPAKTIWSPL